MVKDRSSSTQEFELISHTADMKMRAYGRTDKELFVHALRGMFLLTEPVFVDDADTQKDACNHSKQHHDIIISAANQELLLVDFLSYALYLSDVHNEIYLDARIHQLNETNIKASVCGIQIKRCTIEIKAVTYHDLSITYKNGRWQATMVFDI